MHFGHDNAKGGIVGMCQRPFASVEEMDAMQIEKWNSRVKQGDNVLICGDFAWRRHLHYLMALNGNKILICGNHDKMSQDVLRNFTRVYGAPPGGMAGVTINNKYIVLSHYPCLTWNGRCHDSLCLGGHVHGRLSHARLKNYLDVGVDNTYANYAPLEFEEILKLNEALPYVSTAEAIQAAAEFTMDEMEDV